MSDNDNTSISPLTYGFGPSSFGDYSSYMPSMMGLTGVGSLSGGMNSVFDPLTSFGAGMYGGGMMGGMMNYMLDYQQNLQNLQNQLELNTLNHNRQMHAGMISNEVQANEETMSGIIQKLLEDGAVQEGVMSLYSKIKEGDQNGVCQEYDKLKNYVYATFDKEIKAKGIAIARDAEARRIIRHIYGQIVSNTARDGDSNHDLEGDIQKYCGSAFQVGFMKGFKGNNNQRYFEETMNHITGRRIDHRAYKDHLQKKGKVIGTICAGLRDIGVGSAEFAGLYTVAVSTIALLTLLCGGKNVGKWYGKLMSKTGYAAMAGILYTGASDVIQRQNSKCAA